MGALKIQDNLFCTHINFKKKKPENIKDGGFGDFEESTKGQTLKQNKFLADCYGIT